LGNKLFWPTGLIGVCIILSLAGCTPAAPTAVATPPQPPPTSPPSLETAAPAPTASAQPPFGTPIPTAPPAPAAATATPTASAQPPSGPPGPAAAAQATAGPVTLALVNGRLIDGTGADPLPDAVVLISGDRIVAAGPRAAVTIPPGARVPRGGCALVDVQGATILPGFINAHVHQGFSASNLEAWAAAGVTTVRDLGNSPRDDLFAQRDALLEDNRHARLVAAGPIVTVPNGYPMVPWGAPGLAVTSPEDAASKVNHLLDVGADVIKIALDSGGIFGRSIPVLSAEEAAAIVKVAHQRGTLVAAHILTAVDLEKALDAGVDDVAHMAADTVPDSSIQRMLDSGTTWVPTLELWKRVGHDLDRPAVANLKRYVAAGGKVALGTDYAGYSAVFDLGMPVTEIELMQQAGMTPMQIIVAATRNAAAVCNLEDELGTLQAGKIADVLVVNGDPLEDMQALTRVRLVIHNGEVIRE
jgi:imidazolonepropionase-like amidohydrolase